MHNNSSISLSTKCIENPPLFINTQHYTHSSRSQYATYGGRRPLSRLSSILQATYTCTVDYSLSGVLTKLKARKFRSRTQITQSRDSENAQCNLEIVLILRLHRTYICAAIKNESDQLLGS